MFGKKKLTKEQKAELKKRKFLSKKFNETAKYGKFALGMSSFLFAPTILIDGGLMFLTMTGAYTSSYLAVGMLADRKANKKECLETENGQKIYGAKWAVKMQAELQKMLIMNNTSMNMYIEDPKKSKDLQKHREMILDTARDLADYIQDVDDNLEPTGKPVLYLERPLTGNDQKDYDARINPAKKPGDDNAPKPLKF